MKNSGILKLDKLGGKFRCRKPTGQYDKSTPKFTQGELKVDTLMRYVSCRDPYIVVTEVDFDQFRMTEQEKFYLALT